jgi:hypothetical protein
VFGRIEKCSGHRPISTQKSSDANGKVRLISAL